MKHCKVLCRDETQHGGDYYIASQADEIIERLTAELERQQAVIDETYRRNVEHCEEIKRLTEVAATTDLILKAVNETVERLTTENTKLKEDLAFDHSEYKRLRNELTTERDALKADAVRYRWIVKNTDCSFGLATFQLDVPHPSYALDVCIDAAIAKESKT